MTPLQAATALQEQAAALRVAALREASSSALRMEGLAKENATSLPRVRTGALRRSIQGVLEDRGAEGLRVILRAGSGSADLGYARVQEGPEDGGAYTEIRARDGGWLAFQLPDKSWRRVRSVRVPATRFLQRAFDAEVRELSARLETALRAAAGEVLGG